MCFQVVLLPQSNCTHKELMQPTLLLLPNMVLVIRHVMETVLVHSLLLVVHGVMSKVCVCLCCHAMYVSQKHDFVNAQLFFKQYIHRVLTCMQAIALILRAYMMGHLTNCLFETSIYLSVSTSCIEYVHVLRVSSIYNVCVCVCVCAMYLCAPVSVCLNKQYFQCHG